MPKRKTYLDLKQLSSEKLTALLMEVEQQLHQRRLKEQAFNEFLLEAKQRGYDLPSLIELMRLNQ